MEFCRLSSVFSYRSTPRDSHRKTPPVTIRIAQIHDIKGLVEVLTQSFHPPHGWLSWLQPVLKLGVYEDLRTRLSSSYPYYRCLVALESGEIARENLPSIVGTVEIALRNGLINESLYISNLAVSHTYRRQGVARNLLLKCEQIAVEWDHQSLSLHVLEDNYPAKKLYLSLGYQLLKTEISWHNLLFKSPKRLFLQKTLKIDTQSL
ncbi:GNAT family N-acetyltransferase [Aphanothece sacrum]|uniref:GCN5 family acetyltransferase n=1 Tax=Aphanothece sacrum FPU1 TaxID=1920663 RepID=A0A401IGZ3_APHSA|nr:GNAT family N-acetyltransferase [Aphanothece sacrum]GBF80494.1 GCN5 family acetyltransferase [Aphanothece sacrum FPU1]GBF85884.1 GCN5 family acetyltransferase [Aphanothece sacrum FPU3]